MQLLIAICALMGYGVSYDGCHENNLLFQVNTPRVDYGIVVSTEKPEIYCDMVMYREIK